MVYISPGRKSLTSHTIRLSNSKQRPLTVFLLALSFLAAYFLKPSTIYNYILNLVGCSLISIHYFLGIFMVAISTDNMVIQMVEKKPFQYRSIFSPPVTMMASTSVKVSREVLLTYFMVMFSIMSTISASAYCFMMDKKKTTKRTMQLLSVV